MPASTRSSGSADEHLWILVLAGGIGSRFWPVSTPARPKQLLPLAGPRPLIVDTLERARTLVPDGRLRVLAGPELAEVFRVGIPDLPDTSYMVEPRARGTGPALARAAWEIERVDSDAVLVSLHSDHLIRPLEAFQDTVLGAVHIARTEELLLTIGVVPDRLETGYGHVQPGEPLIAPEGVEAFRVEAFHEKPDAATASRYVDAGYLWNSGIFVWKASVFLDELRRHAPEVSQHLPRLTKGSDAFFESAPDCVVDRAVLERSDRVGMVRATFEWDDVGSWEALLRTREADAAGNVSTGHVQVVDGAGNVSFAEGGRIVLWDVDDLVVVRTDETTLVMPRDRAPDLKELLGRLDNSA